MKILNLVYPEQSDIDYKISRFPDGQQDVTISSKLYDLVPGIAVRNLDKTNVVQIKSHLNTFRDLELIICANAALKRLGIEDIHLYIPYLLGARSDRQFVEGGTSYLVDVVAPIINAQNFKSVTVYDAHSDVAAACINNFKSISDVDLVRFALNKLYGPNSPDNFVLVSPDGGSLKKIYKVAEAIGFNDEIITCSKYRDTDGKLSKTHVPYRIDHYSKDMIIIDDICDGGRTFINIANEILKVHPDRPGKIYLIVTHGIFSAGFDTIGEYFDGVFCTNSVRDWPTAVSNKKGEKFIKQLNIF